MADAAQPNPKILVISEHISPECGLSRRGEVNSDDPCSWQAQSFSKGS